MHRSFVVKQGKGKMKDKLIDTCVFVDYLRGKTEAKVWLQKLEIRHVAISAATYAELVTGCQDKTNLNVVNQMLSRYTVHHFNSATSQHALDWYKKYRLSHGVDYLDCLIAATAVEFDLQICIFNLKHFLALPGVDVTEPY